MQQLTKAKIIIGGMAAVSVVQTVAFYRSINYLLKVNDQQRAVSRAIVKATCKHVPPEYLEKIREDIEFDFIVIENDL